RVGLSVVAANYHSLLPDGTVVFSYIAPAGVNGPLAVESPLRLNGGSIRGADGTDAMLSFTPPDFSYVIIDTSAPVAPVVASVTTSSFPTIRGTAVPGATVEVYYATASNPTLIAIGGVSVDSNGNWALDYARYHSTGFGPGTYTFSARTRDTASNFSGYSNTIERTIPTSTLPRPTILGIDPDTGTVGDGYTSAPLFRVFGTSSPGAIINLNSYTGTVADAAGNWRVRYSIPSGFEHITATARDSAGLSTAPSERFDVLSAPVPVIGRRFALFSAGAAADFDLRPVTMGIREGVGATPLSYSATNLPPGLTLSTSGRLTGTPSGSGTYLARIATIAGEPPQTLAIAIVNAPSAPPPPPPSPEFVSANIGAGSGSTSGTGSTVSLSGAGEDIWGSADAFRFHSRALTGDGEIVARLAQFGDSATHPWAKAGVMFRDGTDAGARNVFMSFTRANGSVMQSRATPGGATSLAWGTEGSTPRWLKLVRAGNTFTGFESTDGVAWQQIGTVTMSGLPSTLLAGLAVTSHETGVPRTATFDNVQVRGAGASPPVAPSGLQAVAVSGTEVELSWNDNSTDEAGFHIERATGGGAFSRVATAGANVTRVRDSGLTGSTTYTYRVSAYSAGGGDSAFTPAVTVTTSSAPPPGTAPNAPSGLVAEYMLDRVQLKWADNSTTETSFTLERSTDGTTFNVLTTLGTNSVAFGDISNTARTATRRVYYYRIRASNGGLDSPWSPVASVQFGGDLPAFSTRNIGVVSPAGSTAYDSGTGIWSVTGGGADIWFDADAFTYESQAWNGDGEFVARMRSIDNTHGWAKAGLMVRESLATNARNVFFAITPSNGICVQTRLATGGQTTFAARRDLRAPIAFKLKRQGNVFTAYYSLDSVSWTVFGTATVEMSAAVYVGLAVTSHAPGSLCTATFSDVSLLGGGALPPPPAPPAAPTGLQATASSASEVELSWTDNSNDELMFRIERAVGGGAFTPFTTTGANVTRTRNTGLTPSTTYSYRVCAYSDAGNSAFSAVATVTTPASPPPGTGPTFATRNVGVVSPAGSTAYDGATATWSVTGGGADIWDVADAFTYESQAWTGDGEFVARVRSIDATHSWAKAGLMFRESLNADARNIFLAVTPENGIAVQARTAVGSSTNFVSRNPATAPIWLKLTRQADVFRAYHSADGVNWTDFGTLTLPMSGSIYVGLAVTSHAPGTLCTARFSDVYLGAVRGSGTTPPMAPTNLSAVALSSSEVELRWTDNASNETSVYIHRSLDNVTFTMLATPGPNVTSYNDRAVTPSTTYYYRVQVANSAGLSGFATASVRTPAAPAGRTWFHADIGAVGLAGSDDASGNTITLRGSGADIWGSADAFHFLYQVVPGDCVVEAQVAGITGTNEWAKAGVMIRENTTAGARNVFAYLTPTNETHSQERIQAGSSTTLSGTRYGTPRPYWVRLARTGNTITATSSPDGVTWQVLGTATLTLGTDALVGFAVTSHDNATLNTVTLKDPFIQ
ncbi:MAG TPA: fibronectin type III domain-containing protein, partial [Opitutaceae bacterium]|nr:fibronectin type III domain-containing protein [Opitutaceae bacterium]